MEAHVGCADKVLAEFITDLGQKSLNADQFHALLKENGSELSFYFVSTLLTVIHAIPPPKPKTGIKAKGRKKPAEFHRLAVPDNRHRANEIEKEIDFRDEQKSYSLPPPAKMSGEPELYGVYLGRVSRVMDTGCFVQLNEFRGKEGLVHVQQIILSSSD